MCCSEREQFQTNASWLKVKTIKKLSVLSYQFLGNYWFSIPLIAFTLNRLSYILFVVLLSVLFLKKVPKTGQSCTAFGIKSWQHCLFAPRAVQTTSALRTTICCQCCRFAEQIQESLCDIFQSVHTSPLAACRNAWGGKNPLRSNIMPPVSKHCSAARCASQRCPSALGGELPFAMNRRVE